MTFMIRSRSVDERKAVVAALFSQGYHWSGREADSPEGSERQFPFSRYSCVHVNLGNYGFSKGLTISNGENTGGHEVNLSDFLKITCPAGIPVSNRTAYIINDMVYIGCQRFEFSKLLELEKMIKEAKAK